VIFGEPGVVGARLIRRETILAGFVSKTNDFPIQGLAYSTWPKYLSDSQRSSQFGHLIVIELGP
jgi:hypothetical protein